MDMSKILPSFRRLRWKLTFSYTAITGAVILTLGAAMTLILVITSTPSGWLDLYKKLAVDQAAEARPVLDAPT
jgi:hypothetical protein